MLGAIIGDIVGRCWEFNPTNEYHFELFSVASDFTDDTSVPWLFSLHNNPLTKRSRFGREVYPNFIDRSSIHSIL